MTDATKSTDVVASRADDTPTDGHGADTGGPRGGADGPGADADGPRGDADGPGADADGQGAAADGPLDEGHLFHLLRSERRRLALRYLLETDGEPVGMRELADMVAAAENGTSVEALGSEERQRAYITLYQSHLPQLDRAGVVEYDRNRGVVEATPLVEAFEVYLDGDTPAADAGAGGRLGHVAAGAGVGGLTSLALVWSLGTTGTLLVTVLVVAGLFGVGLARLR